MSGKDNSFSFRILNKTPSMKKLQITWKLFHYGSEVLLMEINLVLQILKIMLLRSKSNRNYKKILNLDINMVTIFNNISEMSLQFFRKGCTAGFESRLSCILLRNGRIFHSTNFLGQSLFENKVKMKFTATWK